MNRRHFLKMISLGSVGFVGAGAVGSLGLCSAEADSKNLLNPSKRLSGGNSSGTKKPNIVMIFVDDWAWNGTPVRMDEAMGNSKMPVLKMPIPWRLTRNSKRCFYRNN